MIHARVEAAANTKNAADVEPEGSAPGVISSPAGGRVRLCNLAERVSAALRLARLDTVLDLYQTEEEALASIQQTERDERTTAPGEPA
jgi:hypothetical protein